MGSMGPRRPRRGVRLCRRCALQRRGETPRLRQILRSTKCDKLSVERLCLGLMGVASAVVVAALRLGQVRCNMMKSQTRANRAS
jgi:hypothetical protein